tara:strand:- start:2164 stop:2382 length:219 start_codon:yes stop_codon:yes gene_type:complete
MIDRSIEVRAGDSYVWTSISFSVGETYGFVPKICQTFGVSAVDCDAHSSNTHNAILDTVRLQKVGSMQTNLV